MSNAKPEMEGDVYYPSDEVVAQANVPDWDQVAQFAQKDLKGFWADQYRPQRARSPCEDLAQE